MNLIKLNATESTNTYLKSLCVKKRLEDYTVVIADIQTKGRGQMGTHWHSEANKNLTFSVFKDVSKLRIDEQFYISMAVALGIIKALGELQIPKLKIKWPNDILADNKKIAGILIENVIKTNAMIGSVIGIGLNVNQKFFEDLPNASSLHLITGIVFDKDEVLHLVLTHIKRSLERLNKKDLLLLQSEYEEALFRLKKPSTFKTSNNLILMGFIEGVTEDGKLKLRLEDGVFNTYDLKEIQLLY